ncbi:MAG: rhodanese-like domain-containing protein [Bacilli bacterium]|nr:rhodanese-like domain-containing protein [Bacilli bacterium]
MRKLIIILLLAFVLIGCGESSVITPEQAVSMMDQDETIVLVDVRTYDEFKEQRIPNAIHVPLTTLETSALAKIPDKNVTYIIYCRSGNRSATAVSTLKNMGYKHLYDLGGIIDWPYETISG